MRKIRALRVAVLAAGMLALASGAAAATTTDIAITTPLTTQTGLWTLNAGGTVITCNVTMRKTLPSLLVPVGGLAKIGRVMSGVLTSCGSTFLNMPTSLGGTPGPNATSWDLSFLTSNLTTGVLSFGILDVQIQTTVMGMSCLYRGTLLGTLSADGTRLAFSGTPTLPKFSGPMLCPGTLGITGSLTDAPAIAFSLLTA